MPHFDYRTSQGHSLLICIMPYLMTLIIKSFCVCMCQGVKRGFVSCFKLSRRLLLARTIQIIWLFPNNIFPKKKSTLYLLSIELTLALTLLPSLQENLPDPFLLNLVFLYLSHQQCSGATLGFVLMKPFMVVGIELGSVTSQTSDQLSISWLL